MIKEPPILKCFFVLRGMIPRGTTFEFEYLGEFEIEIKNILGHELGAHMRLIHEKNQRPKISCYCTFKQLEFLTESSQNMLKLKYRKTVPLKVRRTGFGN